MWIILCISKTQCFSQQKKEVFKILVNEYTKLDPTLPRVSNIPCPNAACVSNRPDEEKSNSNQHEVIYLRYNDAALKFVYICNQCDTIWKSAESK